MAISAAQVKELREKTGAGMMDCKKALTEADGDFQKAIEILRKKGASVAAKRAERSANEGIVKTFISDDNKTAYMVEVNCETDFVAKSDDFLAFADLVLNALIAHNPNNVDDLLAIEHEGKKLQDELTSLLGKIGEKIEISRFIVETSENGLVVDYVHHGSKLGVLVRADNVSESKEEFSAILKDVAMQVAAMKPLYVSKEDVPEDVKEKEMEIYKEIAKKEGKPEQVLEKIAVGRLNKFYQENCLLDQAYVKDNTKTIGALISEFNKKTSQEAKLVLFHRFHLSDETK
ncbi:MAG: translation elongation factor Ts [Melioribacteraceae bacterium]|nr:translation elongation factor Ts [Melioribacteraceae bacterium]MCF8353285.1 translation elongation factor Ts [Melioribacteraceae bacterium]MCF8394829.1 translation elongation factor Ts [Melioribacteraceae bacterium]MCF8418812.1 translation elongation factor Ts [Melioribacteraceae bacterium]